MLEEAKSLQIWAMEWIHLFGKGRGEKEKEGVASYTFFPSPGIYFSTESMGWLAGRMVPKTCRGG